MANNSYHSKSIDELTFTDDGMFQTVLHDPKICAELIERLLHVSVNYIEYPELEKQIAPYYSTKGVRLDVYLKDSDKIIDVEMQSHPQEALGKRTRYYQSMIDIDSLMKGQDYPDLKESYIVFICKEDPFKNDKNESYGLPCYSFKNQCSENPEVKLNDKSCKVIYNASAYREAKDPKIRDFLHFISTNEPGKDEFSKRLSDLVNKTKENEIFRREYAAMNLHDRDIQRTARKEGIAEGTQQKAIETAINLLKMKLGTIEQIAQAAVLPVEKVKELAASLNN